MSIECVPRTNGIVESIYNKDYCEYDLYGMMGDYENGTWFKGTFLNGKYHGCGILSVKQDDKSWLVYEGQFSNGQKNGIGKLLIAKDTFYGPWVDRTILYDGLWTDDEKSE